MEYPEFCPFLTLDMFKTTSLQSKTAFQSLVYSEANVKEAFQCSQQSQTLTFRMSGNKYGLRILWMGKYLLTTEFIPPDDVAPPRTMNPWGQLKSQQTRCRALLDRSTDTPYPPSTTMPEFADDL
jgi:hypothetical protein